VILTFDCYGTLIDWESGIHEAFRAEAARDGVAIDRTALIDLYHRIEPQVESESFRRYREVLEQVTVRIAAELEWPLARERAAFLPESLPQWPPFPDTNPALRRLSAEGWRLGILSNVDDDLIAGTREHLDAPFDLVITAEQVRSYKPAHGHFLAARERIGDERWIHVAQSYFHDVVPATELGIECIWINRKSELPPGDARPDREFATLEQLTL
jgi:2-haloalkanoic acid dehalogenase type II